MQGSPHPLIDGEPSYVAQYRAVGIERARIDQDCLPNTLTLGGIFPDEAADPSRAGSYRFEAVDAHLRAAREAGCDVLWNTEWQGGEFLSRHLGVSRERASLATPGERRAFASGLAAYAIACKLRWQSVVTESFYYRANHRAFPPGHALPFGELGPGHFFTREGHVGALAMQEALLRDASHIAPERCHTAWNDDGLLACVGLRSHDGTRAALLASNLSTGERVVTARFAGASLNGDLSVRETALAAETRALAVEARPGTRALGGVFEVTATLAPLSSKLIVAGA
ncbi:MAG: hypothetical protein U0326_40090 [Polyangiales bacterium]